MNARLHTSLFCALSFLSAAMASHAADRTLHSFKQTQLTDKFWSEGAAFADLNKDGHNDIISGPYWWEGPDFTKRHEFYPAKQTFQRKKSDGTMENIEGFEGGLGEKNTYSDNFFAFTLDFNNDGWTDILIYGFPGKDASWFENPGKAGINSTNPWVHHVVFDVVDNESPTWADVTGDGKPEIVCMSGGFIGYASPDWKNPSAKWTFHPISPKGGYQRFTHGLGVGDVNGDGRMDILEKGGWWEQPASLTGDPEWKLHKEFFGTGGSQMYVYDLNGDGLNDVITSLAAHGFGIAWFEQYRENGEIKFRNRTFMNKEESENRYGLKFAQLHAIELVDMDGDGIKDIVTGKRFWAHGPKGDVEPNADPVLYWFKTVRNADKSVDFVPNLISSNCGIGTQLAVGLVNKDALPDVVVGNKKGTFVLIHEAKNGSAAEWEKAQPKVLFPDAGKAAAIAPRPAPAATPAPPASVKLENGVLPVGRDGKTLNTDFETGDLRDWTATGEAFKGQPYKGPIDPKRPFGAGRSSNHQGEYWMGGYEVLQDKPTGTLSSAPFKATQPWAAFLFNGGSHPQTRVELVRADNNEIFFKTSGWNNETMLPVVVDLQPVKDKEIFIRLVDDFTGGWGHINFDNFRLYAVKPAVAAPAPAIAGNVPPTDEIKFSGLTPDKAAKEMILPAGFKAHVFAAEPDIRNPIAFCIDDRSRLWVVEGLTYPQRAPEGQGKDRIIVFEDTDGDHKFDKRTVFMEGLNLVSGIEYGFGGVWVGAAPYLYFIPIADGDAPKPAGPPQVVLEGWGYQDTHETLNTFRWGPDGWLYGCHGVFTHSHVKAPGALESTRQFINAGIWRYHPTKKTFEVFAEGTSNPWGMDFDEHGQIFMEGCVIPHLWHMIQGARYQRQGGPHYTPSIDETLRINPTYFTQDFGVRSPNRPDQPYIYDDIKTIADHLHYAGATPHSGNGRSSSAGGGHAHAGLMVYLGNSWPAEYRGKLFMNNIHGARMNMDIPVRAGSGFSGKHGADFLLANDKASQMMDMRYDQDGSVYVIDWYDINQCHRPDRAAHDYENGRIFKIVYNDTKTTKVDLQKATDEELVKHAVSDNAWLSAHARRILQERFDKAAFNPSDDSKLTRTKTEDEAVQKFSTHREALVRTLRSGSSESARLKALWALHVTTGLAENLSFELFRDKDEWLRSWAIQLLSETNEAMLKAQAKQITISPDFRKRLVKELSNLAREDKSPIVRLYLASAAQRLPVEQRWDILAGLTSHAEDATDHNLPLMAWYAGEPLVAADPARAMALALDAKLPRHLEFTARRTATLGTPEAMQLLVKTLGSIADEAKQRSILRGMSDALKPQRQVPMPEGWDAVATKLAAKPALKSDVNSLSVKFGSDTAMAALREQLTDRNESPAVRASALDALLNAKAPRLAGVLHGLLNDATLRGQAVRALANYDDALTPKLVLAAYPQFSGGEKRDALNTLSSRAGFARALVAAVEQKSVPVKDLTAETVRQIRNLGQIDLN
ncbi:MAG TPA: PVC-type heme-binding CxxCH protein, partial [Roseimicrobium sp.]|nr:PVC-type heme-binding CxxCH protein [Roseimicrobium sp.]